MSHMDASFIQMQMEMSSLNNWITKWYINLLSFLTSHELEVKNLHMNKKVYCSTHDVKINISLDQFVYHWTGYEILFWCHFFADFPTPFIVEKMFQYLFALEA